MVLVSIDVEAANGVVASLRATFDEAMDEWTAVANNAASALSSTQPLHALSDPLVLISDLARDLETRVELAIACNTGGSTVPTSGTLEFTLPGDDDSIDAVKAQLGIEIAQGIEGLSPYGEFLDHEDVERFDHYTSLLAKYGEDELVTNALFQELGPAGIVQVPIMLKDFEEAYSQSLGSKSDEDLFWEGDTPMVIHLEEVQQEFLEAFGTGLATSTTSPAFQRDNPTLAADLVEAVTQYMSGSGWGLSQVLRYGEYDGDFLVDLGGGLYDWEKDQSGAVWAPQAGGQVTSWRLGTDDDGAYFDPFVGLFEAMGRSPEGAADFFNPDGGGAEAEARSKYLIEERNWRADDFNSLGEALDAAATSFRGADDPRAEQAAWIASATVQFLGERDGDPAIGDAGKDSFGHILATYVYDIDRVAGGVSGGLGTHEPGLHDPWEEGLPIGADFDYENLQDVMAEVLTDTSAVTQLGEASAAWNGHRIAYAAENWGGEGTDSTQLQVAVNRSSTLNGFVLSVMGAGLESQAKDADENAQAYIDLASDVVGLVPTGGTFTSFLADQALSQGKDAAGDAWTGNESRVAGEQHTIREVAYTDLQIAMAVALAENDHLPAGALLNEADEAYAWFDATGFNADALKDPQVRNDFISWVGSTEPGETASQLLPDIAAMFDRGVERGSR